jgi:FixJ family two-component response regulator
VASGIVAVVDDHVAIVRSLKLLLELEGYEVVTYTSARSFLVDDSRYPACLIVDQNMPEMTGIQLVTRFRERAGSIPVLLVCGSLSPDIVARATALGIERVLQKPTEPGDILQFVAESCRHRHSDGDCSGGDT